MTRPRPITNFDYDTVKTLQRMVEYDRPCGVVTPDNFQIWVNQASEDLFKMKGEELVQVCTSKYWHPEDLKRLHQQLRQTSKNTPFEFTYRAGAGYDDEEGNPVWFKMTNRYEIIAENGNRLGLNLESEIIAAPSFE